MTRSVELGSVISSAPSGSGISCMPDVMFVPPWIGCQSFIHEKSEHYVKVN